MSDNIGWGLLLILFMGLAGFGVYFFIGVVPDKIECEKSLPRNQECTWQPPLPLPERS